MQVEPGDAAISFQDMTVSMNGHPVLDHLDLNIHTGERIVITGRNGAGKTTLLKTILGLINPVSGSCTIHRHLRPKNSIAYLNQQSIHVDFPISATEVAEIGVVARKLSRASRIREVRLAMETTRCDHLRRRNFAELSGGEKQKVSLARCIAQGAKVLLLDEPCSSLDPASKAEILVILEDLNERLGATIVMVSHDEETSARDGWERKHLENGTITASPGRAL